MSSTEVTTGLYVPAHVVRGGEKGKRMQDHVVLFWSFTLWPFVFFAIVVAVACHDRNQPRH